tara:strand:- start:1226 stop:1780 length:555 start_codon:yes stop_codon:yes gene_type:complete
MNLKYFLLFLIPLFIIFLNLQLLIFNDNFYDDEISDNLLNYFKDKEELKLDYTEIELIHLEDVKGLINTLKIGVYILGILILLIMIFSKDFSNILLISGLITIGIVILLFLIDFSFLFTKFHEILFTNNYWLLPPNTLLIKTYPLEFFINFFKRLILNIIITSFIVGGIGLLKNVYTQHKSRVS